jgi:cell division protein FtsX
MLGRILSNTRKQISRAGWSAWASISVMTLAFLVATIFGGLAFISNIYIQYIESKSNVLVFFEEGMDQKVIEDLQTKWANNPKIKNITYTSEEDAYKLYADYTAVVQKEVYTVLKTKESKTLPSSLDIQIYSLSDLASLKSDLERDIEDANKSLQIIDTSTSEQSPTSFAQVTYQFSKDPTQKPIVLKVDDQSLDQLRQVLYFSRVVGIAVLAILFIGIFFFTFLAIEFRLQSQTEEIGVMQLVGGSLLFIRSPYILEGGFYGFVGAAISSLLIGGFLVGVFVLNKSSTVSVFLYKMFNQLPWPEISSFGWIAIVLGLSFIGFFIGALSSYLSIRRYIR